ncbi:MULTISPECIES: glycoside hydrolase family 9 protein [Streptomyces]|uniref:Endoglucanase n=1 Tax=Streptomyces lonegramiae TaxID=3075524 RepID=A0ABU2XUD0_9ACTN|nr:glycoside hydrolase family 9 protein [Streptomyces sp. DSM 41529]MDT0548428.1 glycoside hydrolase family 9 protein [Streptomyces sp. DSM 41529]
MVGAAVAAGLALGALTAPAAGAVGHGPLSGAKTAGAKTGPKLDTGSPVRVNQVGYLTHGPKQGTVVTSATKPLKWTLRAADGTARARGTTTPAGVDPSSRQNVQTFDFSKVTAKGKGYTINIDGKQSEPFSIDDNIYSPLVRDSLEYFYQNRSGIKIDTDIVGGKYARPAGHDKAAPHGGDTNVPCQTGVCDYRRNVSGGWYDAGDQGKYVVNGGISVAQLMSEFERTKTTKGADAKPLGDGKLRVPEHGNGIPDILDEARWEMDFLMRMQVPKGKPLAGMAFHKVHDKEWTGFPTRPDQDKQQRELHAPSTAATLNLAATAAQSARLFKPYDPQFAARSLHVAKTAWAAAKANPNMIASDQDSTGGGAYGDANVSDEFYWAAAELFITTGDNAYRTELLKSPLHGDVNALFPRTSAVSWASTAGLGQLDLATVDNKLTAKQRADVRKTVIRAADRYAAESEKSAYGVPYAPKDGKYEWGSNSQVLNNMVVLATAHDLTGKTRYRDAVLRGMDYLLGANPLNQSYVTGYGERSSHNQHHRFWAHQIDPKLPHPARGSLAGGPNSGLEDPVAQKKLKGCAPAMCYTDNIMAFSTNEITINWNAPLAWISSYANNLGKDMAARG